MIGAIKPPIYLPILTRTINIKSPTISSFTPTGQVSTKTIVITGTNFTGATVVAIGGTNVSSFSVDSPTQITATIDATIRSGTIAVTTPRGTATSAGTAYCLGSPTLWLRADAGVLTDGAAAFASGSSQYMDIASSASFQMNATSFTLGGVFSFTTLPTAGNEFGLLAKWTASTDREYYLGVLNTAGTTQFELVVRDTGDTTNTVLQASTFGALTTATTYKVIAGLDTTNNVLFIEVNGTRNTVAYSSGVRASTNNFTIGALSGGSTFCNGTIDSVGIWKHAFSAAEATSWAAGMRYPDLTGSLLTNLIAFYDFASNANLTTDATGNGNTLTNHSATFTAGLVSGTAVNGDVVTTWQDQSGNARNATQSTGSLRPILTANAIGTLPGIKFDGVDDYLLAAIGALNSPATFYATCMFTHDQAAADYDYIMELGTSVNGTAFSGIARNANDGTHNNFYYTVENNTQYFGPALTTNTGLILSVIHQTSGTKHNLWINGASQSVDQYPTAWTSDGTCYLGSYIGALNFMQGYIVELLIFPVAHSATQRQQIETYLNRGVF